LQHFEISWSLRLLAAGVALSRVRPLPQKEGLIQGESGLLCACLALLAVGTRSEDIHDAVQILHAGKLDTHLALADTKGDLDVGIKAIG
jgi:hypothetical protein